jgi:hypothetical protein
MCPLMSQTNRMDFNSEFDSIIIFLSYIFKYLNETFRMEYDQRVIIRFLHNKKSDTHNITQRPQAQFAQDAYILGTVQFWIGEICCDRQDLHDENRMGRLPIDI